ncbi:unnamed protein product [Gongylonema pulchrum]|uniref:Protein kinase domain-containing protein n=1 Tax=Gongylonema pulchrum TaxID=637853 RepID=A0A3P7NF42_9BILA|nr:unnamed protein product [Gongylonema pulchrum]
MVVSCVVGRDYIAFIRFTDWKCNDLSCYESATSLYIVEDNQNGDDYSQEKRWPSLCGVALYKGAVVSIDEITYPRKTKELTRTAKLEMRIMRQLHHDNVNSFMGELNSENSAFS